MRRVSIIGRGSTEYGRHADISLEDLAVTAFADRPLYAVAMVDLDEGERVIGRLENFEPPPPLGAAVEIVGVADGVPVFAERSS